MFLMVLSLILQGSVKSLLLLCALLNGLIQKMECFAEFYRSVEFQVFFTLKSFKGTKL